MSPPVRVNPSGGGFARRHWEDWSPAGWYDETTFARVAAARDNPDWVDVTLHSARVRWDEMRPDPASAWLEEKVPDKLTGPFRLPMLPGVGHLPRREAPRETAGALVALFTTEADQREDRP